MDTTSQQLDAAMIRAHALGATADSQVLHTRAANYFFELGDDASGYFHLTHSYVYALTNGDTLVADELADQLSRAGRL